MDGDVYFLMNLKKKKGVIYDFFEKFLIYRLFFLMKFIFYRNVFRL